MPQQSDHSAKSLIHDLAKQFEVVFHESMDVLFIVDGESGIVLDVNRTMTRTLGYEREAIVGQKFDMLTPIDTSISTDTGMLVDVRTNNDVIEPLEFLRADGGRCTMNVAASIIPWDGNRAIMLTLRDITERREREKALEASELRHRLLLNSIQSPTVALDRNITVLYCNESYATLLGTSIGEIEGKALLGVSPSFSARPTYKTYLRVLETGKAQTVEGTFGVRHYSSRVFPTPWGILAISEDITTTVEYAAKMAASEQRYRQMFERNQAIKLLIDPENGTIIDANPAAAAFYGYTLEDLKQQNVKDINTLSPEEVLAEMAAAKLEQRRFFRFSHRLQSGEIRDVEVHSGPVDVGEQILLYSVIHDVTDRNQLESALRESEARYRGILEDQTELICRFLEDGMLTYVNPAVCRYFGMSEEALIGRPFIPTIHDEDMREVIGKFRTLDANNPVINFEFRIWQTPNDLRWVNCTARIIIAKNGAAREYQVVGRDVTEHKQTEQSRRELDRRREQARVLTSFIQDASHEFRTPLSIISTNLYLLKRGLDLDNTEQRFEMIDNEVDHILELVEGLVTMARLDQELEYGEMSVNLNEILRDRIIQTTNLFLDQNLKVNLDLAPNLPLISGNVADLHLALGNIVDNAIRFTPSGGTIQIKTGKHAEGIFVDIADSGEGMVEDVLPHIFERFYRVDKAHTTRGFGLGLPIAQRIIEGHGGRIEVESVVNEGTAVKVILPIKEAD
jgi:PAS domain S-box-containing protein